MSHMTPFAEFTLVLNLELYFWVDILKYELKGVLVMIMSFLNLSRNLRTHEGPTLNYSVQNCKQLVNNT